jgi:hypothetical protein
MAPPTTEQTGLTRREILKRGAAFGGALVWATPVVQVMGMSSAHARPVSPGCIRYCLKWETDGNQRILDTETGDYELTCDDLVIWTSFWVGLGGSNADEVDDTEQAFSATTEQTDESVPTSSTTSTTESLNGTAEEEEEEEEEEGEDLDDENEEADGEVGEGEADPQPGVSEAIEESESSSDETDTSSGNELTENSHGNGQPEETQSQQATDHQGNCIRCDTASSVNSDAAAQQLADDMGIEVYGDPITGFYVSIPSDCSLADLEEEGLDPAAVKVGGQGGGECSVLVDQVPDPCRPGYTRIVLPNPDMAQDISHIELIIDCCE